MSVFEGLIFYEIVLLVLGILFFITLLFVLIFFVVKNRPIKVIIPLFFISIIMMGFSGIKKVSFNNIVLEIEKLTAETKDNPSDDAIKQKLENKLAAIDTKRIKKPETVMKLEKAYTIIGEPNKAIILNKRFNIIKLKKD
jgi:hypothetical protein